MQRYASWGVLRERDHSPNRVLDDERILISVAERLSRREGIGVEVLSPKQAEERKHSPPDLVFYMCEESRALDLFGEMEAEGTLFVNSIQSVRNTFRNRTLEILASAPYFPRSAMVSTADRPPLHFSPEIWLKRGDYHAIAPEDVSFARTPEEGEAILSGFRGRGIRSALAQEHIGGDLIKFYGVRDHGSNESRWFHFFYHRQQELRHHPFDPAELRRICEDGAERLGLEIYGGDAIASASGRIHVIDFNAWPSFALYREEASDHISRLIADRLCSAKSAEHFPRLARAPAP